MTMFSSELKKNCHRNSFSYLGPMRTLHLADTPLQNGHGIVTRNHPELIFLQTLHVFFNQSLETSQITHEILNYHI